MADTIVVDIIVVARDVEAYIYDCLLSCSLSSIGSMRSIMRSRIICVDDGSVDGTSEEIDRFRADYTTVSLTYIKLDGQGAAAARNFGMDHCEGRYIAFVDGDDLINGRGLVRIIDEMSAHGAEIGCARGCAFDDRSLDFSEFEEKAGITSISSLLEGREYFLTNYQDSPSLLDLETSMCMRVFDRAFLSKNNVVFPDLKFCEDVFPSRLAFMRASRVIIINCYYYCYRINRLGQRTSIVDVTTLDVVQAIDTTLDAAIANIVTDMQGMWLMHRLLSLACWSAELVPASCLDDFCSKVDSSLTKAPPKWWWCLVYNVFANDRAREIALLYAAGSTEARRAQILTRAGLTDDERKKYDKWLGVLANRIPREFDVHGVNAQFHPFSQAGIITKVFLSDASDESVIRAARLDPESQILGLTSLQSHIKELPHISAVGVRGIHDLIATVKQIKKLGSKVKLMIVELTSENDLLPAVSYAADVSNIYVISLPSGRRVCQSSDQYDVSIIVPVFNVEQYVRRCAESLARQDFAGRLQIIFVDDGSTDGSSQILSDIKSERHEILILKKANGGAASARNLGLKHTRGTYVGFVDGDDYVTADYVSSLYEVALNNKSDISQASFSYVDAATGSEKVHVEWFDTEKGLAAPAVRPGYVLIEQTPGIWRRLYKSSFLRRHDIAFNEEFRRHDDLPFNVISLFHARDVAITRGSVYKYLLGRDGQDVGATDERLFIHFRLFEYINDKLGSGLESVDFLKVYLICMCGHHMWAFDRIAAKLKDQYHVGAATQLLTTRGPLSGSERIDLLRARFPERKTWFAPFSRLLKSSRRMPLPCDPH